MTATDYQRGHSDGFFEGYELAVQTMRQQLDVGAGTTANSPTLPAAGLAGAAGCDRTQDAQMADSHPTTHPEAWL